MKNKAPYNPIKNQRTKLTATKESLEERKIFVTAAAETKYAISISLEHVFESDKREMIEGAIELSNGMDRYRTKYIETLPIRVPFIDQMISTYILTQFNKVGCYENKSYLENIRVFNPVSSYIELGIFVKIPCNENVFFIIEGDHDTNMLWGIELIQDEEIILGVATFYVQQAMKHYWHSPENKKIDYEVLLNSSEDKFNELIASIPYCDRPRDDYDEF